MRRLVFCITVVGFLAGVVPALAEIVYSVTDLGDLPGGDDKSRGVAINEAGQIAGDSEAGGGTRAFMWQNGAMTDLAVLSQGHNWSEAWDINDSGQVVGSSRTDDSYPSQRPFIYSNSTMTNLGSFGGDYGFTMGINNAGQVVGLSRYPNGVTHAFRWSNGTMIDLGSLDESYSCAYAINNAGQIVGVSTLNGVDRGFLWENDTMSDLGDLPGGLDKTRAYDINNFGQIAGESAVASSPDINHAFLWQDGAMTDLGVLPNGSDKSYAYGINDDGLVVGTSYIHAAGGGAAHRAFIWGSVNGMQDLNDMLDSSGSGWTLMGCRDINNAGQIVGFGINPDGFSHGFLLTPIPEPSTFVLLGMGAFGLLVYVWRWRARVGSCAFSQKG